MGLHVFSLVMVPSVKHNWPIRLWATVYEIMNWLETGLRQAIHGLVGLNHEPRTTNHDPFPLKKYLNE